MSSSYTVTEAVTFTVTHARHIASRVATDLKRMQRFYISPIDAHIAAYETEAIELLKVGYLDTVIFGFMRDGRWIEPTLRYRARDLAGASAKDDDPGRVRPGADISGASFNSHLTYSAAWHNLSDAERHSFEQRLPFKRSGAAEPGVSGYFAEDRTYSAGGRALDRASVRSF
ncbi:MAG TPA: hypothetical protein VGR37_02565 [Longimicrobiaceae bacterium]|nr:hypothetical protein [Longimicrobiaceae bacterium]